MASKARRIKIWTNTVRKDFEPNIGGPTIYRHRWKKEWSLLFSAMASPPLPVQLGSVLTSSSVEPRKPKETSNGATYYKKKKN